MSLCPYCGSHNVLPFEEESGENRDLPVVLTLLTALGLLALYFAFVVTSYLYFPVVVFMGIIISTKIVNRRENAGRKNKRETEKDFICLSCNRDFRAIPRKNLP